MHSARSGRCPGERCSVLGSHCERKAPHSEVGYLVSTHTHIARRLNEAYLVYPARTGIPRLCRVLSAIGRSPPRGYLGQSDEVPLPGNFALPPPAVPWSRVLGNANLNSKLSTLSFRNSKLSKNKLETLTLEFWAPEFQKLETLLKLTQNPKPRVSETQNSSKTNSKLCR